MSSPSTLNEIESNLVRVREKIADACERSGRELGSVQLVAVSKTKPISLIKEALAAGQTIFGENYVQEAVDKINQMAAAQPAGSSVNLTLPEWHFIGSLQSNKAKQVAGRFALVHSVDRLKLARALDDAGAGLGHVQPILLQIHIGAESTKHGFSLDEAPDALLEIAAMPHLSVRGLMSLPPLEETQLRARDNFSVLRRSLEHWRDRLPKEMRSAFRELSMGTSADYEAAILEGATLVRLGTTIFGARG